MSALEVIDDHENRIKEIEMLMLRVMSSPAFGFEIGVDRVETEGPDPLSAIMHVALPITDPQGNIEHGKTWTLYRHPAEALLKAIQANIQWFMTDDQKKSFYSGSSAAFDKDELQMYKQRSRDDCTAAVEATALLAEKTAEFERLKVELADARYRLEYFEKEGARARAAEKECADELRKVLSRTPTFEVADKPLTPLMHVAKQPYRWNIRLVDGKCLVCKGEHEGDNCELYEEQFIPAKWLEDAFSQVMDVVKNGLSSPESPTTYIPKQGFLKFLTNLKAAYEKQAVT